MTTSTRLLESSSSSTDITKPSQSSNVARRAVKGNILDQVTTSTHMLESSPSSANKPDSSPLKNVAGRAVASCSVFEAANPSHTTHGI